MPLISGIKINADTALERGGCSDSNMRVRLIEVQRYLDRSAPSNPYLRTRVKGRHASTSIWMKAENVPTRMPIRVIQVAARKGIPTKTSQNSIFTGA